MTNKEILQSDVLDIIFENRNKVYGAYAIRRGYNNRMLIALGSGMSVILLLIFINGFKTTQALSAPIPIAQEKIVVREIKMPVEKPKEIEQPKETVKQKTVQPKMATVKFTTPPEIKDDNKVKETMVAVSDMDNKKIADVTGVGTKFNGIATEPEKPLGEPGNGTAKPAEPKQSDFVVMEREPEFPGGAAALKKFLGNNLSTPDELNAGEKKVVQVKFKVDKDGTVTGVEILTSGGNDFDREVVRVCKKCPNGSPPFRMELTFL